MARLGSPALSREQAQQALDFARLPVVTVPAAAPYTSGKVPTCLTIRQLPGGRVIIAIGEWPFTKHAELEPAVLIDALTEMEPAHGC